MHFIYKEEGDYISYISTKPITKPLKFNINMDSTLKAFMEINKDLVATVGSKFQGGNRVSNRGISKTANSVINGGYSNVSMLLHGFTAAVFMQFYDKTEFSVSPVAIMGKIIKKSLPNKEDWIEGYEKAGRNFDPHLVIKINAVADVYLKNN